MSEDARIGGEKIIVDIVQNSPLYKTFEVQKGNRTHQHALHYTIYGEVAADLHCIYCNRESFFKRRRPNNIVSFDRYIEYGTTNDIYNQVDPTGEAWYVDVNMSCQRDSDHKYRFIFLFGGRKLQKVGQYPSLEDISSNDIERFRPVLPKRYFSELHRAGGLASHGIGIGSFVYLRRIFEKLIIDHHAAFVQTFGEIDGFATMRMDEKIGALSAVLPSTLVEYKQAYGILSKGIHELDEDTCRVFFPVVKALIVAILEQDLQERAKKQAADNLKLEMQKISQEIASKKT